MTSSDPAGRSAVIELAQALMAEITGRLEDLAGLAAERQLSTEPQPDIEQNLRTVLVLVEGHRELLTGLEPMDETSASRRHRRIGGAAGTPRG